MQLMGRRFRQLDDVVAARGRSNPAAAAGLGI
jgi:hypothetical protein